MKYFLFLIFAVLFLSGCSQTEDDKAKPLLDKIESLYEGGKYAEVLDSITMLRSKYPKAIESRNKALVLWCNASLKLAQDDVAQTELKMREVRAQLDTVTDRYRRNMLSLRHDSLEARFEAMCGVVRMIHMRQKKQAEEQNVAKDNE